MDSGNSANTDLGVWLKSKKVTDSSISKSALTLVYKEAHPTYSPLLTVHSSLPTPHYPLLTAHSSLPTPHSSLPTLHSPLNTLHSPLPTPHSPLPTPYSPLPHASRTTHHTLRITHHLSPHPTPPFPPHPHPTPAPPPSPPLLCYFDRHRKIKRSMQSRIGTSNNMSRRHRSRNAIAVVSISRSNTKAVVSGSRQK